MATTISPYRRNSRPGGDDRMTCSEPCAGRWNDSLLLEMTKEYSNMWQLLLVNEIVDSTGCKMTKFGCHWLRPRRVGAQWRHDQSTSMQRVPSWPSDVHWIAMWSERELFPAVIPVWTVTKMDTKHVKHLVNVLLLVWSMQAAFCKICGSDFEDIRSRALLSDLVVEGTVDIKYENRENPRYNVSVLVSKIFKGSLNSNTRRRVLESIRIGEFGPLDKEECLIGVTEGLKYVFFLRPTRDKIFYKHASLPVESSKKTLRQVRGILCKNCGKFAPSLSYFMKFPFACYDAFVFCPCGCLDTAVEKRGKHSC
jgi:hypothetical protein